MDLVTIAEILNMILFYGCVSFMLLLIAIFMIRIGLRPKQPEQPKRHKHEWKIVPELGKVIDIPPVEPNPPGFDKWPIGVFPDNHYGTFEDTYRCDCGDEKTVRHKELY